MKLVTGQIKLKKSEVRNQSSDKLIKLGREVSRTLGFKQRFLMTYRPRICPFDVLMDFVPDDSSILDIGCGNGLWLFLLSRLDRIASGIGIEVDREKIAIAESIKDERDNLEFIALKQDDDWPKGEFDCVTLIDVLHHVAPAEQRVFIDKLKKMNAKCVIIKDIDPKAKIKSFFNTLHDLVLSGQKTFYCEKEKVAQWLTEDGFKVSRTFRCDRMWYSHYVVVAEKS